MPTTTIKAVASPNIAFIKYWGNQDHALRIPANPSLSMTLEGLETSTSLTLHGSASTDELILNGERVSGPALDRVSNFLTYVRSLAGSSETAKVESTNNYPSGAGIASSAAAFAALAVAASFAYGLDLTPIELSRLARRGSGSAARSVFGGFVELLTGRNDEEAFARPYLPAEHWKLEDWIAIVDPEHKPTGSTKGHVIAKTSPIQPARINDSDRRMQICRDALLNRDFSAFSDIVEQDSNLMHAVMITSSPSLLYLQPTSLFLMRTVKAWRKDGIEACYTIDAGPNVHIICTTDSSQEVERRLKSLDVVRELIHSRPGSGARLEGQVMSSPR
jgi:diphosphomevalonate decarboxylase